MKDALSWIDDELAEWSGRGLRRTLAARGPAKPGRFQRDGRELINFGSNDYLGLAADPRLAEAARLAAQTYGWGAGASPLVAGWTDIHQKLVEALAAFEQTEAALLFPTGFAANLGTIAALVGKGDAVYSDRLNHACLIDGARLSGASVRVYPHNDATKLSEILEREKGRFRRSLIVTDGVFSMDGDLAPLSELADLAKSFGAMLMVDEAHGTGVFGPTGQGAASALGVANRIQVKVGTLSKAIGSLGGFVAGSQRLVDWLTNRARTQIYSTSLPTAAAAAALEALRIIVAEPWRREHVSRLGFMLREGLAAQGFDIGKSAGPIVPVVLGEVSRTMKMAERLLDQGLYIPAIRPPTVPEGTARLRISLSAAHSPDDVAAIVSVLNGGM